MMMRQFSMPVRPGQVDLKFGPGPQIEITLLTAWRFGAARNLQLTVRI